MRKFHDFSIGVHWIQMNSALRPRAMFMETMMHHTRAHIQPWLTLSSVTAKDVLLHAAARMASVPEMFMGSGILKMKFSTGMSQMCLPYPRRTW